MEKLTLENINVKDHKIYDKDGNFVGEILYEYVRGSWLHGLGVEGKSDRDLGGVFICAPEYIYGLNSTYIEQITDEKNDKVFYEIGKWIDLLSKSNPNVLESLFVPQEFVIGNIHPIIKNIIDHGYDFISQQVFETMIKYSQSQIQKAKGYNKKCNIPENFQRKTIMDFCHTFHNQGSICMSEWLNTNGLEQRNCGLVNIPNMPNMYGVYYDWGQHFKFNQIDCDNFINSNDCEKLRKFISSFYFDGILDDYELELWFEKNKSPKGGYMGIISSSNESNSVRFTSVQKNERPICYMSYNQNGYESHCKKYKEWSDWKNNRNQTRYDLNKNYNFDAKNMCECVRLINMGIELAKDSKMNVKRTWDRDFLLDIKNHKFTYDEIMKYIIDKTSYFDNLIKKSPLPKTINQTKINKLLIDIRKTYYNTFLF